MYRKRFMATQMTLKRLLTAILLQYTLALPMQAQTVIEGNVTDSLHRAVDAYVTVAPKATASILGRPTRSSSQPQDWASDSRCAPCPTVRSAWISASVSRPCN